MSAVIKNVMVTGAAGFVGQNVIFELLSEPFYRECNIFALDILPPERIAQCFNYSPRVLPISINLCHILEEGTERDAMDKLMQETDVVMHIAGCVDTRESPSVQKLLDAINHKATVTLAYLAEKRSVRFVFVSSAAAGIVKNTQLPCPAYLHYFLHPSLLTSMAISSYGASKRRAEEALLQQTSLKVIILRPHVVWGRGDPLSTELLLNWPTFLPFVLFGDANTSITEIRADILAKYVLIADAALRTSLSHTQRIYHVGSSATTLGKLQQRITRHKQRYTRYACYINGFVAFLIVWLCELLDRLSIALPMLRLLTPNNLAYCSRHATDDSCMDAYDADCKKLYDLSHDVNSRPYDVWLTQIPDDTTALQQPHQPPSATDIPLTPTRLTQIFSLGPVQLRNRIIKAATFECMCDSPSGVPTDQLISFHKRVATGGAAMTIVAYASVSSDGRSFASQISLNPNDETVRAATHAQLRRLCSAVHHAGALAALQITHAGAFADPSVTHLPPLGPAAILNPLTLVTSKVLTPSDETRILNDFVSAVAICRDIGFDVVEIHLGHGYLLSQYLSAKTNPKSCSDRLRFPLSVVQAVCNEAHRGTRKMGVMVKFNVSEAKEEDLPHADIRSFASAFLSAGADMLVPSGGHVMSNGLHMLRGGRPLYDMAMAQKNWLKRWVIRSVGWLFVANEPYREAFFREKTLSAMLGAGIPLDRVCLIGGVHDVNTAERGVLLGFAAVQMGRVLLADPDWCHKVGITAQSGFRGCAVRVCDNSNECIVGATMAQTSLRCNRYINDW